MAIMIDWETWDTQPTAIVRALGMAEFDPHTGKIERRQLIDATPSIDDQISRGRTMGEKTVKWWKKQAPFDHLISAHADITTQAYTVSDVLATFRKFVDDHNPDYDIWSRGAFDLDILRDLYASIAFKPPWEYWQECDVRTLDRLVGKIAPKTPHDPLSDIDAQIKQVSLAYQLTEQAARYREWMQALNNFTSTMENKR